MPGTSYGAKKSRSLPNNFELIAEDSPQDCKEMFPAHRHDGGDTAVTIMRKNLIQIIKSAPYDESMLEGTVQDLCQLDGYSLGKLFSDLGIAGLANRAFNIFDRLRALEALDSSALCDEYVYAALMRLCNEHNDAAKAIEVSKINARQVST